MVAALANPEEIDLGDDDHDEDGMHELADHPAAGGGGSGAASGTKGEALEDDPMFQPL